MKTLHLYVLRQALATLVMTVCVFAFILLLGNILKEVLALLVNRQASLFVVVKAIGLLLPWIMAWVLPFALLTAMVLLFGRLSADNELTAIKASGISLLALVTPLLLFSLVMSGVCAWFNLKITPESRVTYKRLLLSAGLRDPEMLITEDRFIDEIRPIVLYVRKKHGDLLEDIWLRQLDNNGETILRISAATARMEIDSAANTITFNMTNGVAEGLEWHDTPVFEPGPALHATNLIGTNVLQTILTNSASSGRAIGKFRYREWRPTYFGTTSVTYTNDVQKLEGGERRAKISDMTFTQLRQELTKRQEQGIEASPVVVQMHQQIAFSFASFAFTLLAIPLGIRAHRRETSVGMALSIILVAIYYSFLVLGEALKLRVNLHPHLIVWIPNLLFQLLGAILLWRANRQG
jgi:lipopolysaccharide export system permease protein